MILVEFRGHHIRFPSPSCRLLARPGRLVRTSWASMPASRSREACPPSGRPVRSCRLSRFIVSAASLGNMMPPSRSHHPCQSCHDWQILGRRPRPVNRRLCGVPAIHPGIHYRIPVRFVVHSCLRNCLQERANRSMGVPPMSPTGLWPVQRQATHPPRPGRPWYSRARCPCYGTSRFSYAF